MSTSTERMRRLRERQKGAGLEAVPDEEPGPVLTATEATLGRLDGPDPALCASARHLAATLDGSAAANPAVAAELRRTLAELKAEQRQKAPGKGADAAKRPPSALEQLRAARAQREAQWHRAGGSSR